MSRSAQTILSSMISNLPRGFALGTRDGIYDAPLDAAAESLADAEASVASVIDELDPRTAVKLLPDFERVLGPDPCGRDREGLRLDERQKLAHQRWTARGGQSIPFFIGMAAKLGVAITIEEFWPSRAGNLRAGRRLIPDGTQFIWRVQLAISERWHFRAGRNVAGQSLGGFVLSNIECLFRRACPEHTTLVFSYVGDE